MNEKNLQYCLYYKGEDECPEGDWATFQRFWYLEQEYYNGAFNTERARWEKEGKHFMSASKIDNVFFKKNWSNEQISFIGYCTTVVPTMSNEDPFFILDYGSK